MMTLDDISVFSTGDVRRALVYIVALWSNNVVD